MRRMGKSTIAPNMLLELENMFIEVSQKNIFERLLQQSKIL